MTAGIQTISVNHVVLCKYEIDFDNILFIRVPDFIDENIMSALIENMHFNLTGKKIRGLAYLNVSI